MMKSNIIKKMLIDKKQVYLSWITIGNSLIPDILGPAGFHGLVIDLEHSSITLDNALNLIISIESNDMVPIIRVGENNPNLIKRVMDAGAYGVIVPNVNSAKDANTAINAVKYPPDGKRGVGLYRAQAYGRKFEEYLKWLQNESVIIVQIENIKAVENIDEIFSVPGIDAYFIGPYDLFDIHYNYKINRFLELNLTGMNIFDHRHKQMIGGAVMGRQVILRLTAAI